MKRVVSVSLGAAKRDHAVEVEILGEQFRLERIGTNGDMVQAMAMIKQLDGEVDAIGLGGIDLYLYAGHRRYTIRDGAKLAGAARKTPVVDGSGLKHTFEKKVVKELPQKLNLDFRGKKILLVSAMDRYGMAEALDTFGGELLLGDLIFSLGIPIPIRSLAFLRGLARVAVPVVCRLPFSILYPTGKKQEQVIPKYTKYYQEADIIAGDFHYIRRYMPADLNGKIIITNTVTQDDLAELKARKVRTLVTTTPELGGRSFGTNVLEGILVAFTKKRPEAITPDEYENLLERVGFTSRIENF